MLFEFFFIPFEQAAEDLFFCFQNSLKSCFFYLGLISRPRRGVQSKTSITGLGGLANLRRSRKILEKNGLPPGLFWDSAMAGWLLVCCWPMLWHVWWLSEVSIIISYHIQDCCLLSVLYIPGIMRWVRASFADASEVMRTWQNDNDKIYPIYSLSGLSHSTYSRRSNIMTCCSVMHLYCCKYRYNTYSYIFAIPHVFILVVLFILICCCCCCCLGCGGWIIKKTDLAFLPSSRPEGRWFIAIIAISHWSTAE